MASEWVRVLLSLAGTLKAAFGRGVKRMRRLRNVEASRTYTPTPETQEKLRSALALLRGSASSHPFWKRLVIQTELKFVKVEAFKQPAFQEWISRSEIEDAVIKAALDEHAGVPVSPQSMERLVASYVDQGFEGTAQAESLIRLVLAWMRIWVAESMSPTLEAELTRHTAARLSQQLDGVAAIAKTAVPLVTREAERKLEKILRCRSVDVDKTQELLFDLWQKFVDRGEYVQASIQVQGMVAYWLARSAAGARRHEEALKWRQEMSRLGVAEPTSLDALIQFAAGNNDAALQLARQVDTSDGRGILLNLLVQIKGQHAAIEFFNNQALQPGHFTGHGYRHYIALLLKNSRFTEAERQLELVDASSYEACIELHFIAGIAAALAVLPKERRHLAVESGWQAYASDTLDGKAAYESAERARLHFDSAIALARECESETLERNCIFWSLAMRLMQDSTRAEAVAEIQQRIARDDAESSQYGVVALMFKVPFDAHALETQLTRKALAGGLTDGELTTKFLLLKTRAKPQELVSFIDQNFARLNASQVPGAVAVTLIEALCASGNTERARGVLKERSTEIGEDGPRVSLAIEAATGNDPSDAAIAQYRRTEHIGDLANVVHALLARGRWTELVSFSREQYARTPNFSNAHTHARALRNSNSSSAAQLAFLDEVQQAIGLDQHLRSTKAWALFDAGEHLQSLAENNQLLNERDDPNDFGLDINLAIATGAWKRFPELLVHADRIKAKMPASGLVVVARVAGLKNPVLAEDLLVEAVRKEPENPDILVAAYTTMVALGKDSKGFAWMQQAIALSKDDGPVRAYSFKELVEFVRVQAESWSDKEQRLRRAEIPIHMAPWLFNISLADILVGNAKGNAAQTDFRAKRPIPLWQGARPVVELPKGLSLALDVTSLYVLHRLGLLVQTLDNYSSIRISPGLMALLLNEHKRVAFHQPSRIANAKPLLALVQRKAIRETRGVRDPALAALLGDEIAALVAAAKRDMGWYVRTRPLHEAGSGMDVVADLGTDEKLVKDPSDLASWLVRAAIISAATSSECLKHLGVAERLSDVSQEPPAAVYLDPVAIEPLYSSGLLTPLVASGIPVYVHESSVRDWQALVDTEPHTAEMTEAIEQICETLHVRIMSGHVKAVSPSSSQHADSGELTDRTLADLIANASEFDAMVVDDRMLASALTVMSDKGSSAKAASTLDVIRSLTAQEVVSEVQRRELLHRLRVDCYYCVPLAAADLLNMLRDAASDGQFRESAELKTLRQYLARLGGANRLCTPGDLEFMDSLWVTGANALYSIWTDPESTDEFLGVSSTWILQNILTAIALRSDDAAISQEQLIEVESERGRQLVQAGARYGNRRPAYIEWLQREYFDRLSPGSDDILEAIGKKLEELVLSIAGKSDD